MPLDASIIARGVAPVQVDYNPVQTAGQIARVQQEQQQVGLGPLRQRMLEDQVSQQDLAAQEAEEDKNDQTAFSQEFHNPANLDDKGLPDWEKIKKAVAPRISYRNYQKADDHYTKMQQNVVDLATSKDRSKTEQFNLLTKKNQYIGDHAAAILGAPPDQKQARYDEFLKDGPNYGIDTSDASQFPRTVPNDDAITGIATQAGFQGKLLSYAKQQADLAKEKEAQRKAEQADATTKLNGLHDAARRALVGTAQGDERNRAIEDFASENDDQRKYADKWLNPLKGKSNEEADRILAQRARTVAQQDISDDKASKLQKTDADTLAVTVAHGKMPNATPEDKAAGAEAELALQRIERLNASKRTLSPNAAAVGDRFNRREVDADKKAHLAAQQQEIDYWTDRTRLGDAIASAKDDSATLKDPRTGRNVSVDEAKALAEEYKNKALNLQGQARQIREKHGWGEFSDAEETPARQPVQPPLVPAGLPGIAKPVPVGLAPVPAPVPPVQQRPPAPPVAAAPPPVVQVAPVTLPKQALQQLKEGVDTKFQNGQIWTLKNGKPVQLPNQTNQ